MIHDTPNGQIWGSKYPSYEFDHVQTNGSNSLDTREMDPIVLLRGRVTTRSKTRASHDPMGVESLTPYVIIDTSCHDVDCSRLHGTSMMPRTSSYVQ